MKVNDLFLGVQLLAAFSTFFSAFSFASLKLLSFPVDLPFASSCYVMEFQSNMMGKVCDGEQCIFIQNLPELSFLPFRPPSHQLSVN
jgi:hypothetical protein